MQKPTILYITELFPYPADSGAKIKTINTIQTLSKKFNIALISFSQKPINKNQTDELKKFVKLQKTFVLPELNDNPKDNLPKLIKNYLKLKPNFLFQFHSLEAEKYIKYISARLKPVVIHIDHLNMAQYLPKKKNETWILEHHNVEGQLAWTKFISYDQFNKTKLYYFLEFLLIFIFEIKITRKFDRIFAICDEDKNIMKMFGLNNILVQNFVYQPPVKSKQKINTDLLFIGDLTWLPNKLAINWFSKKVWPLIKTDLPNTKMNVVGDCDPVFKKQIEESNLKVLGYQKDIAPFIKGSKVFVMPFMAGGGIRVKALTAMSYQLPIVSTKFGMRGLSKAKKNSVYLCANNETEFAKQCMNLLRNNKLRSKIGTNGFNYLLNNHSDTHNQKYLDQYQKLIKNVDNS